MHGSLAFMEVMCDFFIIITLAAGSCERWPERLVRNYRVWPVNIGLTVCLAYRCSVHVFVRGIHVVDCCFKKRENLLGPSKHLPVFFLN